MTEVYEDDGTARPVTIIDVTPSVVTQVKTVQTDGYNAVQIGYGVAKAKRVSKPMKGHLKDLGDLKILREYKVSTEEGAAIKRGDKVDASGFKVGDLVTVRATSKGKGFQGAVKLHNFGGGRRTHGQKHSEREPGTISGGGRAGGRVAKGIRMAGRMGGDSVTIRNLRIVQIDPANNELLLEGAIPGVRGAFVEIMAK